MQVLVGQRLAPEEAEHEDPVVGEEVDDGRTHAGGRGADAVLVLGPAIDGELVGGRRGRVAEDKGPVGGRHLVVLVGETPGERLDPAGPTAEDLDPLEEGGVEVSAVAPAHRRRRSGLLRAATRRGSRARAAR